MVAVSGPVSLCVGVWGGGAAVSHECGVGSGGKGF